MVRGHIWMGMSDLSVCTDTCVRRQLAEDLLEASFHRERTHHVEDRTWPTSIAWSIAGEGARAPVDLQNAVVRSLDFIQNTAGFVFKESF